MFSTIVPALFRFMESDFGFRVRNLSDRSVQFERSDIFVELLHSNLDEVSLRVGSFNRSPNSGFGIGMLIALTSPVEGYARRDRIASTQEQVQDALSELADLLQNYGQRVLRGDPMVFDELQRVTDEYWVDRAAAQIRRKAEAAFAAKNFAEALQQYRLLGERRKPLDSKRMEICERNTR